MVRLGNCYRDGTGVERDKILSLSWFLRAAQPNGVEILLMTGFVFEQGYGGVTDLEIACQYYRAAAALGNKAAAAALRRLDAE